MEKHNVKSLEARGRSPTRGVRGERASSGGSASPSAKQNRSSSSPNKGGRGRSKSPSKFNEKDFERKKVSTDSAKKRQNAMAKVRGLKLDPSQWSRQELIDKLNGFAHFNIDDKNGIGTLSSEGRRLLSEDVQVLLEIMRRVTEIQTVNLSSCGLTDEVFGQLLNPGLVGLRHLKELRLQSNLLSSVSVLGIVNSFSKLSRKLELLDLQFNSLIFEDGSNMYAAFSNSITELNGFPIGKMLQEASVHEVLDVSGKAMRLAELGIVCRLMQQLKKLHTVNLANNRISALGLNELIAALKDVKHITSIDISGNPATDDGKDFTGVQALVLFAKSSTQLQRVICDGLFKPDSKEESALQHSLMANRSVAGHLDGSYFNKFAQALIEKKAKPPKRDQLASWQGKVNELDLQFIKNNSVPHRTVRVVLAENSLTQRDEIIINRVSLPTTKMLEF